MATETVWQSTNGKWDDPSSWTQGVPSGAVAAKLCGLSVADVRLGLTGADTERLIVTPEYTGQIGAPGSPLEIDMADGMAVLRGRGRHYIKFASGNFPSIVCDSDRRGAPGTAGSAGLLDGTIARLCVKDGGWMISSTCKLIYQVGLFGDQANLEIRPKATTENMAPVVVVHSGTLLNDRPSDAANYVLVSLGGLLIQRGLLAYGDVIVRGAGGLFRYEPLSDPPTDPEMILADGFSDFRGAQYDFGVDKLTIGPNAEVEAPTMFAGGYPPGALSNAIDLREEYP